MRIARRNARFQEWQALLTNRTKRTRSGEFLVHGVRPITLADQHGWEISALLHDGARTASGWAADLLARHPIVDLAPELLAELAGGKDEAELVAVVRMPRDDVARLPRRPDLLVVCFDRPTSPGNLGSLVRSADAFGAHAVVVTGHAADPYDPQAVRASTGSLFALPVLRLDSPRELLDALDPGLAVLGSDEDGDLALAEADLTGPTLLVVGNETRGMSRGWREACQHVLKIPTTGSASSLNAANAGTVLLYEAARQRRPNSPVHR